MMRERGKVFGHSGEYKYSVTDLWLDVPGLDFSIHRTYRSQIAYHSRLGKNWDSNLFARYLRYGSATGGTAYASGDMCFYRGDGRRDKYTLVGGTGTTFTCPKGFYDKFAFSETGYSQEIRRKDGSRLVFSETQVGSNVVHGRLSNVYGPVNANTLSFHYDYSGKLTHLSSSTGIGVAIAYNAYGYLERIYQYQDTSHEVKYYYAMGQYDSLLGRVEYATTTFYDYDGDGELISKENSKPTITFSRNVLQVEIDGVTKSYCYRVVCMERSSVEIVGPRIGFIMIRFDQTGLQCRGPWSGKEMHYRRQESPKQ